MSDPKSFREFGEMDRRGLIRAGGIGALGLGLGVATRDQAQAAPARGDGRARTGVGTKATLRFRSNGKFKIIQFNDTQDNHNTDKRTVEFQRKVIEAERPDLVVLVGDQLIGDMKTVREQKQALNNVIQPMEEAGVPWALTFGNHDEDSTPATGMDEPAMLKWIRRYEHNMNTAGSPADITGTGNMNLLIGDSSSNNPVYGVWLLDSGRYAPEQINGQDFEGYPDWDWVRADQVRWYMNASEQLEDSLGGKIPSLMFLHIALWEHRFMWWASVDSRTPEDHRRAVTKHSIVGDRNEDECPGPFNSGLFSALLHRGDVDGVFVGHDHINTYVGDYYGIKLGYGPGTGFGPYGMEGDAKHHLRGARVYELDESAKEIWTGTRLVFARDLGIDMSVPKQPMEPLPLPKGM